MSLSHGSVDNEVRPYEKNRANIKEDAHMIKKLPYENVNNNIMRAPKEEENKSRKIMELSPDRSTASWVPEPL